MSSEAPVSGQETSETKNAVGRPRKLTVDQTLEVFNAFEQYIKDTADPTVPKFVSDNDIAIKYKITRDNLNDWPEFSTLIKRAVNKQESYLLEYGGSGKYNPTIAIFRLKQPQHGYSDKVQTENSGEQKLIIETRRYKRNVDNGNGTENS